MDEICKIAKEYNLKIIEDAAQSFGSSVDGKMSCSFGDIGCTSFFPAKPLGCYGDGGALFTDDKTLAERMRMIRVHGQGTGDIHTILGLNGRFDTIQAAILLAKMSVFDDEIALRQKVAGMYRERLENLPGVQMQCVDDLNTSGYAQFTFLSHERDRLRDELRREGTVSYTHLTLPTTRCV